MLVLLGKQGSGKSGTLLALTDRLGQFPQFSCERKEAVKGAPNDRLAIFTHPTATGAVKVAVVTAGDKPGIIEESLSACAAEGADIIVCACREEEGKGCWKACKGFADGNKYTPYSISNTALWQDGRSRRESPFDALFPFWNAYSAEALLLAVMHIINTNAKDEGL